MHDRLYPFFFNVLDEKTLIYRIQDHSSTNAVWGGGDQGLKKCQPPWLADEENFRFLIV